MQYMYIYTHTCHGECDIYIHRHDKCIYVFGCHVQVVLEPDADKAKRTAVHKCVRSHFAPLESDSVKVHSLQTSPYISANISAHAYNFFSRALCVGICQGAHSFKSPLQPF